MQITAEVLSKITGKPANANMRSVVMALDAYGRSNGLDKPHRLAHFLAQLIHESGAFRYDREVWGPTPAQERYDTRVDLGNTAAKDGDGKKNAGRGPIQLTGAGNIGRFYKWCVDQGMNPPDFRANPDLINTDPWEGLSAIWFWSVGNQTGKSLNRYADANDLEMVTRKINGGTNGLADRINWYTKTALVLAGYAPDAVKSFQIDAQRLGKLPKGVDQIDGVAGPKTRSALHLWLADLSAPSAAVKAAPVTETVETVVPAVPEAAEKTLLPRITAGIAAAAPAAGYFVDFDQTGKLLMLGIGIVAVIVLLWKGELIAQRARRILKIFDGAPT